MSDREKVLTVLNATHGDMMATTSLSAMADAILAALRPSRPAPRETPLLTEALDLVPRISDDDPMVPALADWCRRVRASLSAAPRETGPSEAPDEVFARIVDLGATERLAVLRAALKLNLLTHAEFDAAQYRELSRAALRASNGGAERSTHAEGR